MPPPSPCAGGLGSIGVDPAATPTGAPYNYDITGAGTVLDDSLTVTGVITGGFGRACWRLWTSSATAS